MRRYVEPIIRNIVQIKAVLRQEHIHTIVKMSPRRYVHARDRRHTVRIHSEPVFQTMLTKSELKDFKKKVRDKYGDDIRVRHRWLFTSHRVNVQYSPDYFEPGNPRKEVEDELYNLLFDKYLRSHAELITPAMTRC